MVKVISIVFIIVLLSREVFSGVRYTTAVIPATEESGQIREDNRPASGDNEVSKHKRNVSHHHPRKTKARTAAATSSELDLHTFAVREVERLRNAGQSVSANNDVIDGEKRSTHTEGVRVEDRASAEVDEAERELSEESKPGAVQLFGRTVTIAITGVDSRLGVAQRHADANHVLRIWLEKGEIEIFSIPRGTRADAGFASEGLNIVANLRSNKGLDAYLKKIAEIAGVKKIDYWVELGFSQAIGVIEMLGFKDDAKNTLHVLRTRKAFAIGDYQRCYNQGQFIRQMLLNNFNKSTGFLGSMALRAALGLVETNLRYDITRSIIEELEKHNFPGGANSVTVRLRPTYKSRLQEINLSDAAAIEKTTEKIERRLQKSGHTGGDKAPAFNAKKYESKLLSRLNRAERSVKSKPGVAITALRLIYKQRSWIQIPDDVRRNDYMKRICDTLARAYEARGFLIEADNIRSFYEQQVKGAEGLLGGK